MSRLFLCLLLISLLLVASGGNKKKNKNKGNKNKNKANKKEADSLTSATGNDGQDVLNKGEAHPLSSATDNDGQDVLSYANLNHYRSTNISIHIFANISDPGRFISGSVEIGYNKLTNSNEPFILDTLNLRIRSVRESPQPGVFRDLPWVLGEETPHKGAPLKITVGPQKNGIVYIEYWILRPDTGIHYLPPGYTSAHNYAYLYTITQPAQTRSWIPCQDTASAKVMIARMRATVPTPYTALMSGILEDVYDSTLAAGWQTYSYRQDIPVAPYHLSLAIGIMENRTISERIAVWADSHIVDQVAERYTFTEDLLRTCENILGPYVWGRYDFLVLPDKYAYWGMEHVNMNYIAGSLAPDPRRGYLDNSLLLEQFSHETIHSWFGNLVTSTYSSHSDLWLNEGITKYFSYYVTADFMDTPEIADFLFRRAHRVLTMAGNSALPWESLENEIEVENMDGVFSSVPYLKGALFVKHLEKKVGGRQELAAFMRVLLVMFSYQNINTEGFIETFNMVFPDTTIEWDRWLYEDSLEMVRDMELPASRLYDDCFTVLNQWRKKGNYKASQLKSLTTVQIAFLLQEMPRYDLRRFDSTKITKLLKAMNMYGDPEIFSKWAGVALRMGDEDIEEDVQRFLVKEGRADLIFPIYAAMAEMDLDLGLKDKIDTLNYKSDVRDTVKRILGI